MRFTKTLPIGTVYETLMAIFIAHLSVGYTLYNNKSLRNEFARWYQNTFGVSAFQVFDGLSAYLQSRQKWKK